MLPSIFKSIIDEFQRKYSDTWNLLEPYLNEDLEKRKDSTEEREIVEDALDYFKPKKDIVFAWRPLSKVCNGIKRKRI